MILENSQWKILRRDAAARRRGWRNVLVKKETKESESASKRGSLV
jgi:hypothetical protein